MVFQCINIPQVPRELWKTEASDLGFQHLPQNLANVNAWKSVFDSYSDLAIILWRETTFQIRILLPPNSQNL